MGIVDGVLNFILDNDIIQDTFFFTSLMSSGYRSREDFRKEIKKMEEQSKSQSKKSKSKKN